MAQTHGSCPTVLSSLQRKSQLKEFCVRESAAIIFRKVIGKVQILNKVTEKPVFSADLFEGIKPGNETLQSEPYAVGIDFSVGGHIPESSGAVVNHPEEAEFIPAFYCFVVTTEQMPFLL